MISERLDWHGIDDLFRADTSVFLATSMNHVAHNENLTKRYERLRDRRGREGRGQTKLNRRPCVISLATADKRYPEELKRLEQSLERVGFSGEVILWPPGTFPAGCPSHLDVPFAFKPFCFMEARQRGCDLVLWLDSSCVVIGSLDPIFARIEQQGYVLFRNERYVIGEWSGDVALEIFGLSREQAMGMPEVNAAALGLSLSDPVATDFLDRWYETARSGTAFRGVGDELRSGRDYADVKWNRSGRVSTDRRVRGHRHDQTVAGILAHLLGMTLSDGWLQAYSRRFPRLPQSTRILNVRDPRPGIVPASLHRVLRKTYVGRLVNRLRRRRPDPRRLE